MKNDRCWESLGYLALIIILIFSFMMGCANKNPNAQGFATLNSIFWKSIVKEKEKLGYKLMNVKDSKRWLYDQSIDQSDLEFLEKFDTTDDGLLRTYDFLIMRTDGYLITLDHNNNPRVFIPKSGDVFPRRDIRDTKPVTPPLQVSPKQHQWENFVAQQEREGYTPMSVQASQKWLDNPPSDKLPRGAFFYYDLTNTGIGSKFGLGPDFFLSVDHNGKPRVFEKKQ